MPEPRQHQRRLYCGVLVAMLLQPLPVQAQQAPPRAPSPVTWNDVRLLGAFTVASAALMPTDRELQRAMQRPWVQSSSLFRNTAHTFNAYGSPGVFAGSLGLYAGGWAAGRTDLARMGLRAWEAIALSGIITGGIKGASGRARPYASPDNPSDWRLFSGTSNEQRQSFPSGHTTAAFAFATALDRELRIAHPSARRWASPLLFGAATLTALARMHSNNHWASDVVMGAGIGTVSALVIARFHADRPQHWIDRYLLPRKR